MMVDAPFALGVYNISAQEHSQQHLESLFARDAWRSTASAEGGDTDATVLCLQEICSDDRILCGAAARRDGWKLFFGQKNTNNGSKGYCGVALLADRWTIVTSATVPYDLSFEKKQLPQQPQPQPQSPQPQSPQPQSPQQQSPQQQYEIITEQYDCPLVVARRKDDPATTRTSLLAFCSYHAPTDYSNYNYNSKTTRAEHLLRIHRACLRRLEEIAEAWKARIVFFVVGDGGFQGVSDSGYYQLTSRLKDEVQGFDLLDVRPGINNNYASRAEYGCFSGKIASLDAPVDTAAAAAAAAAARATQKPLFEAKLPSAEKKKLETEIEELKKQLAEAHEEIFVLSPRRSALPPQHFADPLSPGTLSLAPPPSATAAAAACDVAVSPQHKPPQPDKPFALPEPMVPEPAQAQAPAAYPQTPQRQIQQQSPSMSSALQTPTMSPSLQFSYSPSFQMSSPAALSLSPSPSLSLSRPQRCTYAPTGFKLAEWRFMPPRLNSDHEPVRLRFAGEQTAAATAEEAACAAGASANVVGTPAFHAALVAELLSRRFDVVDDAARFEFCEVLGIAPADLAVFAAATAGHGAVAVRIVRQLKNEFADVRTALKFALTLYRLRGGSIEALLASRDFRFKLISELDAYVSTDDADAADDDEDPQHDGSFNDELGCSEALVTQFVKQGHPQVADALTKFVPHAVAGFGVKTLQFFTAFLGS